MIIIVSATQPHDPFGLRHFIESWHLRNSHSELSRAFSKLANTDSTGGMAVPVMDEVKLLSEALSTVKIQVQQMKRHLVCETRSKKRYVCSILTYLFDNLGAGPAYGRIEECQLDAGRIADVFVVTKAIL